MPGDSVNQAKTRLYLTFEHGGELYATDVREVREILPFCPVDAVPGMNGYLRGVIRVRDSILPVIDLDTRMGGARSAISLRSCIMVLRVRSGDDCNDIGIMVDAAWTIAELPVAAIRPARPSPSGIRGEYVLGMSHCDGRPVTLLDLQRLAAADPLPVKPQAVARAADRKPAATPPPTPHAPRHWTPWAVAALILIAVAAWQLAAPGGGHATDSASAASADVRPSVPRPWP
ncbi:MAG: chemotaxis protein CheW [Rhodocyclales bacterium]|nr:chemotaxis protein CheW [Rhodocyclales bacterium]